MLNIWILKIEMHIRLYDSCGTGLGGSIAEVTDNIHAIGVVKPVYEHSTEVHVSYYFKQNISPLMKCGESYAYINYRTVLDIFL